MARVLGGGLILLSALLLRRGLVGEPRRRQDLRRELSAALDALAAEIKLLLTPLPRLLRGRYAPGAEAFFRAVTDGLSRGRSLEEAWRAAAADLPLGTEDQRILTALASRLNGAEESVCRALTLAAEELRQSWRRTEEERRQRERLTTALCLGIGLLWWILLL